METPFLCELDSVKFFTNCTFGLTAAATTTLLSFPLSALTLEVVVAVVVVATAPTVFLLSVPFLLIREDSGLDVDQNRVLGSTSIIEDVGDGGLGSKDVSDRMLG